MDKTPKNAESCKIQIPVPGVGLIHMSCYSVRVKNPPTIQAIAIVFAGHLKLMMRLYC